MKAQVANPVSQSRVPTPARSRATTKGKRKPAYVSRSGDVEVPVYSSQVSVGTKTYDSYVVAYYANGKRQRRRFPTLDAAKPEADRITTGKAQGALGASALDPAVRIALEEALTRLAKHEGTTKATASRLIEIVDEYAVARAVLPKEIALKQAADFYVARHPANLKSKTVAEVVAEFIADRENAQCSVVHVRDLPVRLGQFSRAFAVSIHTLDAQLVQTGLNNLKRKHDQQSASARTKKNVLRNIRAHVAFARRRKYIPADLALEFRELTTPKSKGNPIGIYTPDQIRRLLPAADADAERLEEDPLARRLAGLARFADESTLGEWLRAQSPESVRAVWDLIRGFVVWVKGRAVGARWQYDGRAENFFDDTQVEVSGKQLEGAKRNHAGNLALSWPTLWHWPWRVDGALGSPGDVSGALPEMLVRNRALWAEQASDFLADSGSSAAKYLAAIAGACFTQWSVSCNKWTSALERTAVQATYTPFTRFQMDVKYLTDLPVHWPQMQAHHLPRFQYTLRELSCGAQFLAYSNELSKTYATFAVERFLKHLRQHGVDTAAVQITTDLGVEFDGEAVHYQPQGFHLTIQQRYGAQHRFNPPSCPNANTDVESVHATVETEFFDAQHFDSRRDLFAKIATGQLWYHVARKNRSRGYRRPLELLALKSQAAPEKKISPKIFLLHPLALESLLPHQEGHHVPRRAAVAAAAARLPRPGLAG